MSNAHASNAHPQTRRFSTSWTGRRAASRVPLAPGQDYRYRSAQMGWVETQEAPGGAAELQSASLTAVASAAAEADGAVATASSY
ncbi:hypothetical protein PC129_g3841 [Phytophthora cactorum]|uniref:Uncharacterized protein n=2 Tax=Phytophthora cactorum TaxID=29920 RepID=A0A8T1IMN2_9STRA|nr:hypothetical protein PC128_g610 [Phytophthora cactorum]KAG3225541.1 hypothetical protein PC129_g3841 [Phytophthora cactorum]